MTSIDERGRALVADEMLAGQRDIGRQEAAGPVDHWCPTGLPGYMQTPAYARTVVAASGTYTADEAERAVADRMLRVSLATTIAYQRRILLTRSGIDRPLLPAVETARQRDRIATMARLDHFSVRILPEETPLYPPGFQIIHSTSRVLVEGPAGCYTPPGAPTRLLALYQDLFTRLWVDAAPYRG